MKNKFEELTLPGLKTYFKAVVIKMMWYQCKHRQLAKELSRKSRIRPHLYGHFNQGTKTVQLKKELLC